MLTTLKEYHGSFSITVGEKGERSFVELNIDAGVSTFKIRSISAITYR